MQSLKLQKPRTWESFESERLEKLSDSWITTCTLAKTRFDEFLYSEFGLDTDRFIKHIKSLSNDKHDAELFEVLQSWIDWMDNSFNVTPASIRSILSGLNKYFRYHRIKITKEDFKEELDYPESVNEEKYALSLDEIQLILPNLSWRNRGFCIGLNSAGLRPVELMGTQKKHYTLIKGKIKLEIPWYLTKKRMSRTVFFSKEINPYLLPILKKLQNDDDFVWTKKTQISASVIKKYSHLKKDKAFAKSVKRFATTMLVSLRNSFKKVLTHLNLDMKYDVTGWNKINLYCFRGRFFTKALKIHNEDTAHALIGHGAYLQQYQRRTDLEKLELFEELESELLIDDSLKKQFELDKITKEKSELENINMILKETVKEKEELAKKYHDKEISPTSNKLIIKAVEDFLKTKK